VIWLIEFRKLALVAQDFESAVADFGFSIELSYVFNLDVRIILKLKVVYPLCIGVEILRRGKKAPIWFLLLVEGELLEILDTGLYGRHLGVRQRLYSSSSWRRSVWSGLNSTRQWGTCEGGSQAVFLVVVVVLIVVVLSLKVSWSRGGWELELERELRSNVDINQCRMFLLAFFRSSEADR